MKVDNLKLNFLDSYYMFYDWLESDVIEKYGSVVLYKVSAKTISDFINYKVKILDSRLIKQSKVLLFSDGYSFIALEFDKNGSSLYKSSLLLEDELKLDKTLDNLKFIKINYEKIIKDNNCTDLRINEEIRKTIKIELKCLKESNDGDKLSYLYYEWFNKTESSMEKMLEIMYKKIEMPLTLKEKNIYDLIKKSYKLV